MPKLYKTLYYQNAYMQCYSFSCFSVQDYIDLGPTKDSKAILVAFYTLQSNECKHTENWFSYSEFCELGF